MAKDKRGEILEKAASLILNRGLSNVTMDMIAEAVPVSKMTIYKYFKSKETLVRAVLDCFVDRSIARLRELVDAAANPADAFMRLFEFNAREDRGFSDEFVVNLANNYPELAARFHEYARESTYPVLEAYIFNAQRAGIVRPDLSPHIVVLYAAAVKESLSRPGIFQNVTDLRTLGDQFRTMLFHGILVDPKIR